MRILTPCLIMLGTLVWPGMGLAIDFNNGAWNTSFDYPAACSKGAPGQQCEDYSLAQTDQIHWSYRGTHATGGEYTQVTAAANNLDGDGGMGARFWVGDGTNINSPQVRFHFPTQQPELWVRWYMRYQAGFAWSNLNYDKIFYMRFGKDNTIASSKMEIIPQPIGGTFQLALQSLPVMVKHNFVSAIQTSDGAI